MTDTDRINLLERQAGNLFTPSSSTSGKTWAWFGDDGTRRDSLTLRGLLDQLEPLGGGTSDG